MHRNFGVKFACQILLCKVTIIRCRNFEIKSKFWHKFESRWPTLLTQIFFKIRHSYLMKWCGQLFSLSFSTQNYSLISMDVVLCEIKRNPFEVLLFFFYSHLFLLIASTQSDRQKRCIESIKKLHLMELNRYAICMMGKEGFHNKIYFISLDWSPAFIAFSWYH